MESTGSVLLDTHVLLWTLLEPARIPEPTLAHIRDPATVVFVSAATAWEIGTTFRLGELDGAQVIVHGDGSAPWRGGSPTHGVCLCS